MIEPDPAFLIMVGLCVGFIVMDYLILHYSEASDG